jgi:hypothetical protein
VCGECCFDARVGLTAQTRIGGRAVGAAGLTCRTCGYDLRGIRDMRCPECAAPVIGRRTRYGGEAIPRRAFVTPCIIGGAGIIVASIAHALRGGVSDLGVYLAGAILTFPAGIGVYALGCALFVEFTVPMPLAAARLAGAFGIADALAALIGAAGFSLPLELLPLAVLFVTYYEFVDLDVTDAALAAFFTHVTRRAIVLGLVPVIL